LTKQTSPFSPKVVRGGSKVVGERQRVEQRIRNLFMRSQPESGRDVGRARKAQRVGAPSSSRERETPRGRKETSHLRKRQREKILQLQCSGEEAAGNSGQVVDSPLVHKGEGRRIRRTMMAEIAGSEGRKAANGDLLFQLESYLTNKIRKGKP